jgi:hypothetical protein
MLKIGSGAHYDVHIRGRQIPRAISISFRQTRGSAAIPFKFSAKLTNHYPATTAAFHELLAKRP